MRSVEVKLAARRHARQFGNLAFGFGSVLGWRQIDRRQHHPRMR
jgi:hypothetical protein